MRAIAERVNRPLPEPLIAALRDPDRLSTMSRAITVSALC